MPNHLYIQQTTACEHVALPKPSYISPAVVDGFYTLTMFLLLTKIVFNEQTEALVH